MKKTIKIMAALVLVAAMVLSIASCGVDMNKIKGDWIISTINGKSTADFAVENGFTEVLIQKQYTFTDKNVTITAMGADGNTVVTSGDLTVRANGVESTLDGVLFGFIYNDKDDALTYSILQGGAQYDYVLKKGTYDLAAAYAEAVAAAQAAQGEAAPAEGAGEENYEDYGEENYEDYGEENYEG